MFIRFNSGALCAVMCCVDWLSLEVPFLSGNYFCQQNGTLKIIDRKKHIFKLAQGEYIAPEKIENVYLRSEALAQVFVHGESLQVGILLVI